MLKKKIDSTFPILDTTQIHKPAHINNSHNQLTQSILIIPTYSITNPKVNSTLRITIQQIIQ
jgi:hypothetical protein